ncbi:MAG: hypothetical protein R2861_15165 [Desulfobacterales bacterium]
MIGFADALILLGNSYQSDRAVQAADNIMSHVQALLPQTHPPAWRKKRKFSRLCAQACSVTGGAQTAKCCIDNHRPTGTISLIAGVSSSIEPVCLPSQAPGHGYGKRDASIYQKYLKEGATCRKSFSVRLAGSAGVAPQNQEAFQAHTDSARIQNRQFSERCHCGKMSGPYYWRPGQGQRE